MANTLSLGSGNWGAKESLLLGYYENGKKFFPETFDVTRATGGTRVNKNGLIETPAEIGSEEITNGNFATDSDWTENGSTLPYMTISGGVLNSNNTNSGSWFAEYISQDVSFVNTKVYLVTFKARSISGAASFRITQNANIIITNNLTTGWVDYSVTYTANADNGSIRFFINNAVGQFEIDNVSVKEYNDKNLARIDYLDDAKGALLTEPQSTNLFTYSENFSEWASYIITPTLNFATSPSGDNNATKLLSSGVFGSLKVDLTKPSSSLTYSQSVFVKTINYSIVNLISYGASSGNRAQVSFDLSDGSVSSAATVTGAFSNPSELIKNYGNGWYRITLTFTSDTSTEIRPHIQFPAQMTNDDYALIWGAQLEQENALGYNGEYSTSYIPTNGSTVTRNKDEVTNGGDVNSFNSEEGVLYFEGSALADSGVLRVISISDGTDQNRIQIRYESASNSISVLHRVSGVSNVYLTEIVSDETDFIKLAFKWKSGDFAFWINGVEEAVSTYATMLPINTLTELSYDDSTGASNFYGKTKNIQVFNTALSDSDLLSLTTTGSVPYWKQYSAMATSLNYTNK